MPREDIRTYETKTECRCPRCGATHYRMEFFTGRGVMRKFCGDCDHYRYRVGIDNCHTDGHGGSYVGAFVRHLV